MHKKICKLCATLLRTVHTDMTNYTHFTRAILFRYLFDIQEQNRQIVKSNLQFCSYAEQLNEHRQLKIQEVKYSSTNTKITDYIWKMITNYNGSVGL